MAWEDRYYGAQEKRQGVAADRLANIQTRQEIQDYMDFGRDQASAEALLATDQAVGRREHVPQQMDYERTSYEMGAEQNQYQQEGILAGRAQNSMPQETGNAEVDVTNWNEWATSNDMEEVVIQNTQQYANRRAATTDMLAEITRRTSAQPLAQGAGQVMMPDGSIGYMTWDPVTQQYRPQGASAVPKAGAGGAIKPPDVQVVRGDYDTMTFAEPGSSSITEGTTSLIDSLVPQVFPESEEWGIGGFGGVWSGDDSSQKEALAQHARPIMGTLEQIVERELQVGGMGYREVTLDPEAIKRMGFEIAMSRFVDQETNGQLRVLPSQKSKEGILQARVDAGLDRAPEGSASDPSFQGLGFTTEELMQKYRGLTGLATPAPSVIPEEAAPIERAAPSPVTTTLGQPGSPESQFEFASSMNNLEYMPQAQRDRYAQFYEMGIEDLIRPTRPKANDPYGYFTPIGEKPLSSGEVAPALLPLYQKAISLGSNAEFENVPLRDLFIALVAQGGGDYAYLAEHAIKERQQ